MSNVSGDEWEPVLKRKWYADPYYGNPVLVEHDERGPAYTKVTRFDMTPAAVPAFLKKYPDAAFLFTAPAQEQKETK